MASVTKFVGAAANATYATGNIAFTNPGNVTADDGSFATAPLSSAEQTQFLKCTMTGNEFAIPSGSSIDGIEVSYQASTEAGSASEVYDERNVHLVVGGEITGLNLVDSSHDIVLAETVFTTGGATQLFGIPLTVAAVNASNFGAAIRINRPAGSEQTLQIDYVQITVYYTEGAGDVSYNATADVAVGMMSALSQLPTSGTFRMMFPGFGTPKAAIIISNAVFVDSGTSGDEFDGSDDPQVVTLSKLSVSAATSTQTEHMRSQLTDGSVLVNRGVFHNGTVSETRSFLNISEFGEDYIEFEVSANSANQQAMQIMVFGGSGLSVAMGNQIGLDGTTNATADITAPGFEPDLVYFFSGLEASGGAHDKYAGVGFGLVHNKGSGNLVHRQFVNENNVTDTTDGTALAAFQNTMRVGTDRCHWHRNYGEQPNITYSWDTLDFDSSGFTIRSHDGDGSGGSEDGASWLALKFPAGFNIAIGDFATPTSTGEKTFGDADLDPDISFTPSALLSFWGKAEALDTLYENSANGDSLGMFMARGPIAGTTGRSAGNGTTTAQAFFSPASLHVEDGDNSTLMRASFDGFADGGWVNTFSDVDATARRGMFLALAPAEAAESTKYTVHALSLMGVG